MGVVRLDANKTDDPRAWALNPGVRRALTAWQKAAKGKASAIWSSPSSLYVDQLAKQLQMT